LSFRGERWRTGTHERYPSGTLPVPFSALADMGFVSGPEKIAMLELKALIHDTSEDILRREASNSRVWGRALIIDKGLSRYRGSAQARRLTGTVKVVLACTEPNSWNARGS
jgi:hypothetical protein